VCTLPSLEEGGEHIRRVVKGVGGPIFLKDNSHRIDLDTIIPIFLLFFNRAVQMSGVSEDSKSLDMSSR
jgi:hypothetical protein